MTALSLTVRRSPGEETATNPPTATQLQATEVVGTLDKNRDQVVPSLGGTEYRLGRDQIESQALGENAPFNQVLLRAPGVAQDSLGQVHVRGEHANLQYRINDVLLPEGITGFGQELDARFVDRLNFITGSLPAQYGFRTAGVVDIHTKNGAFDSGGEAGVYGGSFGTIRPSFEDGGSAGKFNYFINGSYDHNNLGIESPTPSANPLHDTTDQYKLFTYTSYIIDDTSRLSLMGSASHSDFQLPNTPGLAAGTSPNGNPWVAGSFDSSHLDENQNEQNYYGVLAYQKSVGDLNLQVAGYGRYSRVHFLPDPSGDLFFNGVASDVDRLLSSGGAQADASYAINDQHTLRGGLMVLQEVLKANTSTTVFPVDANGDPTGAAFPITDDNLGHALFYGFYLQDEWKIVPKLTLNFGARFDVFSASFDHENQVSPRINAIWEATGSTTLHAGYARYFTPPPLENVPAGSVTKFNGTSNASDVTQDSPGKAERSHYFDAGVSQKLLPGWRAGVDGYYKIAHNQLDDGFFGQSLIPSSFNYRDGRVYGAEFTTAYEKNGFAVYANVGVSKAQGRAVTSGQFLFDADDLAYIRHHWVYLDHDQRVTGSFGTSYTWTEKAGATRVYVDALYGSGLRTDATTAGGQTIPNGGTVPSYYSVNLGAEQTVKLRDNWALKARMDVVNVTDNIYELRDGGGIGVNAAQFGMRRGIFGSIGLAF